MITINTISEKYFSLNGINFAKIYQPLKQGSENIGIYNVNDSRQQILQSTRFDEIEIDGVVYGSQEECLFQVLKVVFEFPLSSSVRDLVFARTLKGGYEGTSADLLNSIRIVAESSGFNVYDSLIQAMAVDPSPEDGVEFVVFNDSDNNGKYIYSSGVAEGYVLLYSFVQVEGLGIVKDSVKAATSGGVFDYVEELLLFLFNGNDKNVIDLNPLSSSRRLNSDGSIIVFTGYFTTANFIEVNEGDVLVYTGAHVLDLTGIVGYSDGLGSNPLYLSNGKGSGNSEKITYEVTIPSGVSFIKACSYTSVVSEFSLFRKNKNGFLWDLLNTEKSVSDEEFIQKNKEYLFGEGLEVLTPYFGGRRLSNNGTSTSFSGWTTSRYLKVNKGDFIRYKGSHPIESAGVVGYFSKNESDFTEYLSEGKGGDLSLSEYYVEVKNENTRYIRACTQNGDNNIFLDEFEIEIIPKKGLVEDFLKLSSLRNGVSGVLSKNGVFVQKYLNGEDVYILCLGDSLTQFSNQGLNENLNSLPPFMEHKNWVYNLWKLSFDSNISAIYRRSDFAGFFTYNGSFTSIIQSDHSFSTVYSVDSSAAVFFDWDLTEFEKTNIVMPKSGVQAFGLKIEIFLNGVSSNGLVEFFDGNNWIEANLCDLDLRLNGLAGEILDAKNKRNRFRVKNGATGVVSVKIFKSVGGSDRLEIWGVEQWNGQNVFLSNGAYGGFATYELQDGNVSNVKDRNCDLVLFELPLINNYGDRYSNEDARNELSNDFEDYIFGERLGFENPISLKNISNNFTDFEVVYIFPHFRKQFVSGNKFNKIINLGTEIESSVVALDAWNFVKKMLIEKGVVDFVDMSLIMKNESILRGWDLEQSYDGDSGSDMNSSKCFTQDTVHLNRLGSEVWAFYMSLIFNI